MSTPRQTDVTPNGAHALSGYAKCERRYYYGQVLAMSERRRGFNLCFGTAWHRAMEAYYWVQALRETDGRCFANRPQENEFADVKWELEPLELALTVMMSSIGYAPEDAEEREQAQWEWGRTWAPGALQAYHQFACVADANEQQVYLDAERTRPAIEAYFEFPLPGGIAPYTGRLDRVKRRGGLELVQEHKTSHPNYLALLEKQSRMAIQFGGYHLGYEALFHRQPAYVELNVLVKSPVPQGPHRVPITRNMGEIQYLRAMLNSIAGEISDKRAMSASGRDVHWRRTGILNGYCVDFNRTCLFMPICKSPDVDLASYDLDSMYNVGRALQELPEEG